MAKEKKENEHPEDKKNVLEWIVFSLSLLLISGIFGYLIYQSVIYEPGSPDLVVTFKSDPSPNNPYRFHVSVENKGQETAEEVNIELVLEKDGQELEMATLQIPYAPKESKREGWMVFSKNPEMADTLYSRVVSYKKP
jgi:uncharacterized protein (TIGR02588 family)